MPQIKIYGIKEHLNPIKAQLSEVIHSCIVDVLAFPAEKRSQRFFPMDAEDFYFPSTATSRHTVIEISMFEGRSVETKKQLIRLIFERAQNKLNVLPSDIEITITETPKHNWGLRGQTGDEITLDYTVEV